MVASGDAEGQQRLGGTVDLGPQLGEGVAIVLEDQRLSIGEPSGHLVGEVAEATLGIPVGHGCSCIEIDRGY